MTDFLFIGSRQDCFVVSDNDGKLYNKNLSVTEHVNFKSVHYLYEAVMTFCYLFYTYKIPCQIKTVCHEESIVSTDNIIITENDHFITSGGIYKGDINTVIGRIITESKKFNYSFIERAHYNGHTHLFYTTDKDDVIENRLQNMNICPDTISYYDSWVSGSEEVINTLLLMSQTYQPVYIIKNIMEDIKQIKNKIFNDFRSQSTAKPSNQRSFEIKEHNPSYIICDTAGNWYNTRLKKINKNIYPKRYGFYDAVKIYVKLLDKGIKSHKIIQINTAQRYTLTDKIKKHDMAYTYNMVLKGVLSYLNINEKCFEIAIKNDHEMILSPPRKKLITDGHDSQLISLLGNDIKTASIQCADLFHEHASATGPKKVLEKLYKKDPMARELHKVTDIKNMVDHIIEMVAK